MDTVMVLSILNGALLIGSVIGAGKDMRMTGVLQDNRERVRRLANSLSNSPDIPEKVL